MKLIDPAYEPKLLVTGILSKAEKIKTNGVYAIG